MKILLVLVLFVLVVVFPPGTVWHWRLGGLRIIVPIGWCILVSLILSVLISLGGRRMSDWSSDGFSEAHKPHPINPRRVKREDGDE